MRILRTRQVEDKVGYSRMHISRLEKADRFPKRIKLNPPDGTSVGWIEEEVDQWIAARASERDTAGEGQA